MNNKLHKLCECANLPKALCNHLVGEHHTLAHRLFVGALIMVAGAGMSHLAVGLPGLLHLSVDVVGFAIHGLGFIPYVEVFMSQAGE